MSQQDNFSGGFLAGAIVGGIAGGLIGALLASGRLKNAPAVEELPLASDSPEVKAGRTRRQALRASDRTDIEAARRSLEDKIAQLNDAIDDVRQQLGGINGSSGSGSRSAAEP